MRSLLAYIQKLFGNIQKKHFLFGTVLVISSFCFAQASEGDLLPNIVTVMNLILAIMLAILTPAIILLGWLLSPDWTMGDFFGLRKYFLQVWILVSNLVYIVFAIMLLYMAVMQIFDGEHEYAFKQKLPKFLGGILLVPFTWLIVSWTLSFANQAVAAVLSIPMGAISAMNKDDKTMFDSKVIPTELSFSSGQGSSPDNFTCKNGMTSTGKKCISPAEFIAHNGSGPFFIILIYAYDIFKINQADVITLSQFCKSGAGGSQKDSAACIRDFMGIVRSNGLSLIVTIFFGIMVIALCWVLLMRSLKLWIYVMFSPLFGLAYFSGQGFGEALHSEGGGGGEGMGLTQGLGFSGFLKLAMVPVLVAAVLSFGLLFIGVMRQSFNGVNRDSGVSITSGEEVCTGDQYMVRYCIQKTGEGPEGYASRLIIGSDTADGGAPGDYSIKFNFGPMNSGLIGDAASGSGTVLGSAGGAIQSVEDIFAHIIITMIALAVMWVGVKAAVQYDAVTAAAFKPFADLGDSVTHFVEHAPSYLPLPHPAFAAVTKGGVTAFADSLRKTTDDHVFNERKNLQDMISNPSARQFDSSVRNFSGKIDELGDLPGEVRAALKTSVGLPGLKETFKKILENEENNLNDAQKTLVRSLSKAGSQSDMAEILKDPANKSVVESLEKMPKMKELFSKIQTSPTSNTTVLNNVTVQGDTINGIGGTPLDLNSSSLTADIKARLTSDQKVEISRLESALISGTVPARRDALNKIGVTVPDGPKREEKEEKIAKTLIDAAKH